jgi:hypothetical protein
MGSACLTFVDSFGTDRNNDLFFSCFLSFFYQEHTHIFTIRSQLVKPFCLYIILFLVLPLQNQACYKLYHRRVNPTKTFPPS